MDKISGIIPSNARTRSVDVSSSQPVRPGAPTYGRPTGRVTQAMTVAPEDRFTVSATDAIPSKSSAVYNNKAELSRAKIVEDLQKKFFEGNAKSSVRETDLTMSEEKIGQIDEAQSFAPVIEK